LCVVAGSEVPGEQRNDPTARLAVFLSCVNEVTMIASMVTESAASTCNFDPATPICLTREINGA
jgi:hypothetical protein